jgi:nicotinate-nucleotide pyrophosphorylase (carboxylating)
MVTKEIIELLKKSLKEDLNQSGDITSKAIFNKKSKAHAIIKSKTNGILSGIKLIKPLYNLIDPSLSIKIIKSDGDILLPQTIICELFGSIRSIFAGERIALNFLGHLSGIATQTNRLVYLISHTKAKILDTRKTTPLLRMLEKQAVVHGGGFNHRYGLYDMILIKDTHIKAAGGIIPAYKKVIKYLKKINKKIKIEIETQDIKEFTEALSCKPHRIMLDNMSVYDMTFCVKEARKEKSYVELEASGNVNESNIVKIAETGVDFISVGSITHSAKSLDIHLKIVD